MANAPSDAQIAATLQSVVSSLNNLVVQANNAAEAHQRAGAVTQKLTAALSQGALSSAKTIGGTFSSKSPIGGALGKAFGFGPGGSAHGSRSSLGGAAGAMEAVGSGAAAASPLSLAMAGGAAAFNLGAAAVKTFASAVSAAAEAASPNVWRTFQGSLDLLVAEVGKEFVPLFMEASVVVQDVWKAWRGLSDDMKQWLTLAGPLRSVVQLASSATGSGFASRIARGATGGSDGPLMDLRIAQPKFAGVDQVWEQVALKLVGESDFERERARIAQESLDAMLRVARNTDPANHRGGLRK